MVFLVEQRKGVTYSCRLKWISDRSAEIQCRNVCNKYMGMWYSWLHFTLLIKNMEIRKVTNAVIKLSESNYRMPSPHRSFLTGHVTHHRREHNSMDQCPNENFRNHSISSLLSCYVTSWSVWFYTIQIIKTLCHTFSFLRLNGLCHSVTLLLHFRSQKKLGHWMLQYRC